MERQGLRDLLGLKEMLGLLDPRATLVLRARPVPKATLGLRET